MPASAERPETSRASAPDLARWQPGTVTGYHFSTFLGMWIFGWDELPKKVHLATGEVVGRTMHRPATLASPA